MITRSVLDTEYLAYPEQVLVAGLPINPVADTVQFAFMPNPTNTDPGSGDWHSGQWYTTGLGGSNAYFAEILVGPGAGGIPLGVGLYNVWVKITDNPQVPVRLVDTLQII